MSYLDRIQNALLFYLVMSFTLPIFGMDLDPKQIQRNITDFLANVERNVQENRRTQTLLSERKRASFDERLRNARSDEERLEIQKQRSAFENAQLKNEDRVEQVGAKVANVAVDIVGTAYKNVLEMAKNEHDAQFRREEVAINARERSKAIVASVNNAIQACTDPKNARMLAAYGSLLALGIFGAKHGTNLAAQMISHWYRIPKLAEETSLLSWSERVSNYIYGNKVQTGKIEDVILEPRLQSRITFLAQSLKNTIKNGAYLKNLLFYGPPGTGKTMLAKRLAYNCGLDYIYFAASSLDQMSLDMALSQLTELFEFSKRSSKKLMIIIDEAEILFANRDRNLSENTRKMLTHILTYTGTETRNFMIIALTNRPEDLDSAFLSRCADRIKIDTSHKEQRKKILEQYINKYLKTGSQMKPTSLLGRMFGSKALIKPITIEDNALNDEALERLTDQLQGFVGRDISQLIIEWQARAYATEDGILTAQAIEDATQIKIEQKKAESQGFGKKQ